MNYILKRGLNIPAVTVLDTGGRVMVEEQRRVFRHLAQNGYGADVIFGVGTTGEWNRIANAERQLIMEIEVDEVKQINSALSTQHSLPSRRGLVLTGRPALRSSPISMRQSSWALTPR